MSTALFGAVQTDSQPINSPASGAEPSELGIFFASETGNSETLAQDLFQLASAQGVPARVDSVQELRPQQLKKLHHAVFLISTHGEGDPPDEARDLFELLAGRKAPDLSNLSFRVLALGDSSYAKFCEAGRELERLLIALGATPFAERVECDVEYQPDATRWSAEVIDFGRTKLAGGSASSPAPAVSETARPQLHVVPATPIWSRSRPFPALVQRVQRITTGQSVKDVYHVELGVEGANLQHQPGDSLGVWAFNSQQVVQQLIDALGLQAGETVEVDSIQRPLHDWLSRHRELTRLTIDAVREYAAHTRSARLRHWVGLDGEDPSAKAQAFIEQRQWLDLVLEHPARIEAEQFVRLLRPLAPRSYSIASDPTAAEDEIHLTVATLYSNAVGERRTGLASEFLNHRLQEGDEVGVFLEPNRRFRLPEDSTRPVIMVGAGTGIAPFRAFMQQLEESGSSRDSWLIYGNPNFRHDFLYQAEWLRWRSRGLLTRIDTAFSRDQAEKRYVQHVVLEQGAELLHWLDRGAHLYLCGALAMGHAVEQSLTEALQRYRGLNEAGAAEWISDLRRERRIVKDLY